MTARRWRAEFSAAASTFDWATVTRLSRKFVTALYASPTPHDAVDAVLLLLRENLRYEELEEGADAALAFGPGSPAVRRRYAQALVDGGNPAVALTLYESIVADDTALARDRTDARGGTGRCYKELYVACADPGRRRDYPLKASHAYHDVYVEHPGSTYHGINAAGLLARAERDSIPLPPGTPRSTAIAEAVLDMLDTDPVPGMWNAVTAAEACVALGRHDDAIERAEAFLHGGPRGFTVASFLRQLQAVWQLDTSSMPGSQLLPVLRSALLGDKGGQVTVESGDVRAARLAAMEQDSHLELVLGHDRYQCYRWYVNGLHRCRAVARIQTRFGDGVGTGFLAAGPDLHPDLPPLVLVTNGHVVPEGLEIDDGIAAFHGLDADPDRKGRPADRPDLLVRTLDRARTRHHHPRTRGIPRWCPTRPARPEAAQTCGEGPASCIRDRTSPRTGDASILAAGQRASRPRRQIPALPRPHRTRKLRSPRL